MGLFVLLAALFETIGDSIKESRMNRRLEHSREVYENLIDFDKVVAVKLDAVEPAYRTETEEEFDIVASDSLSRCDGWQHYETKTVEYEVEDGEYYHFTVTYKNGNQYFYKYHCSRPIAQKLLNFKNHPDYDYNLVHTYCEVAFDESGRTFHYRAKNLDLEIGHKVFVPTGYKNEKKIATVESIEDYVGWAAPYPLEKTKFIIGKVK